MTKQEGIVIDRFESSYESSYIVERNRYWCVGWAEYSFSTRFTDYEDQEILGPLELSEWLD